MLGEGAAPADVAALRRDLGLDRPLVTQYVHFLSRAVRGDLGESFTYREPVTRLIAARYPATLELAATALCLAVGVALPLGGAAALRPHATLDWLVRSASLAGVCLPSFW